MNKLSPEHIHLLLDEPIYVLSNEHPHEIEAPEQKIEMAEALDAPANIKGKNLKSILIIIEEKVQKPLDVNDEKFLFKGLNACGTASCSGAASGVQPAATAAPPNRPVFRNRRRSLFIVRFITSTL